MKIISDSKPAYQVLENKPGYIPVYIRFGDQPLADINPILAEAFGEHEVKARNAKTVIYDLGNKHCHLIAKNFFFRIQIYWKCHLCYI